MIFLRIKWCDVCELIFDPYSVVIGNFFSIAVIILMASSCHIGQCFPAFLTLFCTQAVRMFAESTEVSGQAGVVGGKQQQGLDHSRPYPPDLWTEAAAWHTCKLLRANQCSKVCWSGGSGIRKQRKTKLAYGFWHPQLLENNFFGKQFLYYSLTYVPEFL